MRGFGVLLALLVAGVAKGQTCDGVLKGDFCCPDGCGYCGESGCGDRNGLNCCTSDITDMCSATNGAAPCIVDGRFFPSLALAVRVDSCLSQVVDCYSDEKHVQFAVNSVLVRSTWVLIHHLLASMLVFWPCNALPPYTSPFVAGTTTTTTTGSSTCDGVLKGDFCCFADCGTCGGTGCGDRNGLNCCTSDITDTCSATNGAAPCIVEGRFFPSLALAVRNSLSTTTPGSFETCDGGIVGIQTSDICCSSSCGSCAGSGCTSRDGGAGACCGDGVRASGRYCSVTGEAPCITSEPIRMNDGSTTTTTTGSSTCDGVLKGDFCCFADCGTCGGSGCGDRNGLNCCTSDITDMCSATNGAAPCIVDGDSTGPTPTSPSPSPSTCSGTIASISTSSDSSSFSGGGCATLTDMYNTQSGSGPLYVLDSSNNIVSGGGGSATPTGYWLLTSSLEVLDGVTLYVHGTLAGGDADVLRIQSTKDVFWEIRAWGGNLSFKGTTVTSWDTDEGKERVLSDVNKGRSFINCVTQFDDSDKWSCSGRSNKEKGTCRMDIIDSTMGNMGYYDAESYGLTWKVRGLCTDLSNVEIMDDHNVYGDIINSEIYGMYYGMYSYGHQGGVWTDNIMRDNILYGFDPHDDSDYLTIARNTVYGNGNHGIIASKRCNNVEIYDNDVYDGDQVGIFLHRSSDDAKVYNNRIWNNGDAGIALMESFNADIYDNTIENCKYGIRLSVGSADNDIHDNTFDSSSTYGLYTYQGSDDPYVSGNNGRVKDNSFDSNVISNTDVATKIKQGDDNSFTNNKFESVKTFEFEDSTDTVWTNNDIGDGCLDESTDFASGSIPSC
ncbi:unnamed protein product [Ectocarpus fasciculatus]